MNTRTLPARSNGFARIALGILLALGLVVATALAFALSRARTT